LLFQKDIKQYIIGISVDPGIICQFIIRFGDAGAVTSSFGEMPTSKGRCFNHLVEYVFYPLQTGFVENINVHGKAPDIFEQQWQAVPTFENKGLPLLFYVLQ
jgi:hypothetical protein